MLPFIRSILFPFRHLLRKIYLISKKQKDFYNIYRKHIKREIESSVNEAKGNILVSPINCADTHFFEGLFARKARLEGYRVYALLCGQAISYCETINAFRKKYESVRCSLCMAEQNEFVSTFEAIPCYYKNEIGSSDRLRIEEYLKSVLEAPEDEHTFLEVQINPILRSALQRHYFMADPQLPNNDKTRVGFIRTILTTLVVMDNLCKRINPKYVLSSHGTYALWGSVVEYCKAHDIQVITWGRSYNKDGIIFAKNASYLTLGLEDISGENKTRVLSEWQINELTDVQKEIVTNFFAVRTGVLTENRSYDYYNGKLKVYSKEDICRVLKFPSDRPIVSVFPNIPWDGQVTGKSMIFPLYKDFLSDIVEYFKKQNDFTLIIRAHPAEQLLGSEAGYETTATLISEICPDLPSNIIILSGGQEIDSFSIGRNSLFSITYSSTISLELTYLNVPVILAGNPIFKGKGIMNDAISREHFHYLLDNGIRGKLTVSDEQTELLYRFSHYFFYNITMPENIVKLHNAKLLGFCYDNETDLLQEPAFHDMFQSIVKDRDFHFSKFYY